MIYYIIIISTIVFFILGCILEKIDKEILSGTCFISGIVTLIVACVMTICIVGDRICANSTIVQNQKIYDSLVYQLESGEFSKDDTLAKKQLYTEIQNWNSDLAKHKIEQNDFWIGIFTPNIYDDFNFIEINK